MTRTADVLGTPGYIAPEQSGGSRFEIAKATDVYGLGAVLYHLLTGRPPFAGQTIYETVKQVLETEPRSPQSLNPKVDRDLSTICLKCLEKDPEHRYPSALSLAEDLARWLGNEPIHARPVGLFTRGVKFLQRHGAATITIALIVSLLGTIGVIISRGELFHRLPPNSIAVLPFENLGDKENAFFADGIQDEILTHLASIADLKVISRSSVMSYRGNSSHNLRHVGQELGVAHLLEGSVQRSGNRVRVNAQLIDARNDVHLWAQTYDRDLVDVFAIQNEIARRIAESLQANLSKREEQALAVKPTENTEAYDAYLRGRALEAHGPLLGSSAEIAGLYERAVQLDPKFATAWARLSRAEANMYFNTEIDTSQRDRAKRALEKAQQLEPNAPETLLALGYYQYWVLRDYSSAENTFDQVGQTAPGSSEVPVALALLARYQGNLNQSITHFEQALTLDPRNVELLVSAAWTYGRFRQFSAALKLYNRALDVTPNDLDVMAAKAAIYQAQGNLQGAAKLLSNVNEQVPDEDTFAIKITQLRLERNYREAMRLLQARLVQSRFDFDYEAINVRIALALMQRFGGDTASAKTTAEGARNTLESLCKDQPENSYLAMELSQAYAAVGDKDSALREAGRTDMLQPSVKDPTQAPTNREILASIQASFGEVSPAISNLAQLLNTPYLSMLYRPGVITPALLRLDPIWDSLRTDPGFQKLCEQKQP